MQAGAGVANKNVRLALATLFLNLAVAAHQEPLEEGLSDAYQQLTALFSEVFGAVSANVPDDVLYRFLVGLGTLLTVSVRLLIFVVSVFSLLFSRSISRVFECGECFVGKGCVHAGHEILCR